MRLTTTLTVLKASAVHLCVMTAITIYWSFVLSEVSQSQTVDTSQACEGSALVAKLGAGQAFDINSSQFVVEAEFGGELQCAFSVKLNPCIDQFLRRADGWLVIKRKSKDDQEVVARLAANIAQLSALGSIVNYRIKNGVISNEFDDFTLTLPTYGQKKGQEALTKIMGLSIDLNKMCVAGSGSDEVLDRYMNLLLRKSAEAAPTKADEYMYGAISHSRTDRDRAGVATMERYALEAKVSALKKCGDGCEVKVMFRAKAADRSEACGAYAQGADDGWGAGTGDSQQSAGNIAISECQKHSKSGGCSVRITACANEPE